MGSVLGGDLGAFSDGGRSRSVQPVGSVMGEISERSVMGGDLGVFS